MRDITSWGKFLATLPLLMIAACSSLNSLSPGFKDTDSNRPQSLTVFAAASLIEAFNEIRESYQGINPGTQLVINYAGSQQLAQQLSQGAPADIYASADKAQIDNVIRSGRVHQGVEEEFVQNRLVVILPDDNPGNIGELGDLSNPGLQILLADGAVPAGQYSLEMLERASQEKMYGAEFKDQVLRNVVSYEENVRAVLSKILLGEADAGIVYESDGWGANDEDIILIRIPDLVNATASYYISPVSDSLNKNLAQDFIDFVLSSAGQDILARYGFSQQGQYD